jgi:hypothetical protein
LFSRKEILEANNEENRPEIGAEEVEASLPNKGIMTPGRGEGNPITAAATTILALGCYQCHSRRYPGKI